MYKYRLMCHGHRILKQKEWHQYFFRIEKIEIDDKILNATNLYRILSIFGM